MLSGLIISQSTGKKPRVIVVKHFIQGFGFELKETSNSKMEGLKFKNHSPHNALGNIQRCHRFSKSLCWLYLQSFVIFVLYLFTFWQYGPFKSVEN